MAEKLATQTDKQEATGIGMWEYIGVSALVGAIPVLVYDGILLFYYETGHSLLMEVPFSGTLLTSLGGSTVDVVSGSIIGIIAGAIIYEAYKLFNTETTHTNTQSDD